MALTLGLSFLEVAMPDMERGERISKLTKDLKAVQLTLDWAPPSSHGFKWWIRLSEYRDEVQTELNQLVMEEQSGYRS
jgi:hypothetical protein